MKGQFNYRAALRVFDPFDVGAITTGEQKGAFSLMEGDSNEIVIFSVQ